MDQSLNAGLAVDEGRSVLSANVTCLSVSFETRFHRQWQLREFGDGEGSRSNDGLTACFTGPRLGGEPDRQRAYRACRHPRGDFLFARARQSRAGA